MGGAANLKAGSRSEKTQEMNVLLIQISPLHSFHCFIKMPQKKEREKTQIGCPRQGTLWKISKAKPLKCVIYSTMLNVYDTHCFMLIIKGVLVHHPQQATAQIVSLTTRFPQVTS